MATIILGVMVLVLGVMVVALCIVATRHAQQIDELQRVIVQMNEEHYDKTGTFLL